MDIKEFLKPSKGSIIVFIIFISILFIGVIVSTTARLGNLSCESCDGESYSYPWNKGGCDICGKPNLIESILIALFWIFIWILFLPLASYFYIAITLHIFIGSWGTALFLFIVNIFYLYVLSIVIVKVYKKIRG